MTPRQNQKKLNESMKMLRSRKVITDDGNVLRVPSTFILIDTARIGCLTPTRIHPFFITPIARFTDTGIITDTARRITAIMAAIIRTQTSIVGITVAVGMPRFHGGLTKKAICGSKIDVLAVHAA